MKNRCLAFQQHNVGGCEGTEEQARCNHRRKPEIRFGLCIFADRSMVAYLQPNGLIQAFDCQNHFPSRQSLRRVSERQCRTGDRRPVKNLQVAAAPRR